MELQKTLTSINASNLQNAPLDKKHLLMMSAGLLLFYLVLYIMPLGQRPLTYPDEVRYAEIPREMLATGDWIVPHLDGLRYFEKPPLSYWANAISISVFGENNFAVRFPSALASGLTTLLLFIFTLRTTLNTRVALSAALIHMTMMAVYVVSTVNTPDNLLTFFLSAGIVLFFFASEADRNRTGPQSLWWFSGLFFGLAFLTKGFLAFAIPFLVLVPWMLWNGHQRLLLSKAWPVIAAAALVIMPWSLLIYLQEKDFWHYFFWIEHIRRFTADDAQHREPFYFFLMYLPVLLFPWFNLIPAAVRGLFIKYKKNDNDINQHQLSSIRLAWLWFLLPFLFFSVSKGKLLTYILPCLPAIAFLSATGLFYYFEGRKKLFNAGILFNTLIFFGLLTGLSYNLSLDNGSHIYALDENDRITILVVTLITGVVAGLVAFYNKQPVIKLAANTAMITPLLFALPFVLPEQAIELKSPGAILEQYKNQVTSDTLIISDGNVIRAVDWYFDRDNVYLISPGELDYGLSYPDAQYKFLNREQFAALMASSVQRPILMACNPTCDENYSKLLPATAKKQIWGDFEIWQYNLKPINSRL
jgi:4-amino-4-deoxy-L-arabinose transferase